jgi:HSP20 family protein
MTNKDVIHIKKGNGGFTEDRFEDVKKLVETAEQAFFGSWYPVRRTVMSRIFGAGSDSSIRAWAPEVDIQETGKEVVVSASLPGMEKKDITVDVTDESVTLRGERRMEEGQAGRGYFSIEQAYGSFYRSVRLPTAVKSDEATATYKDGVLRVSLPKQKETTVRTVKVD